MTIFKLIQLLHTKNIIVFIDNGKLKVDAPKGSVTPEILSLLKKNKEELITYLTVSNKQFSGIPVIDRENDIILSYAQQRLWFIDQMEKGSSHYNMPGVIKIKGDFKVEVAQMAFTQIIERHEPLRTVFVDSGNGPLQLIRKQFEFAIIQTNLKELTKEKQDQAIASAIKLNAEQSFDLSNDLMIRVSYLQTSQEDGVLLFNMHHIASDGWSIGILENELLQLYSANLEGLPNPLTPLKIQYADYAHWQRGWLSEEVLETQLNYWSWKLADLPQVHNLSLDYDRPQYQTFNGASCQVDIDSETLKNLKSIAIDNQATLFMLIHAAFTVLLSRYSNSTDIVIGTPVANRLQKQLEGLIGFFVNTLVLRADCANNPSFVEFLAQIKHTNLDAQANQDVPFEHLLNQLKPTRSTSHNALFQIMLSMEANEEFELNLPNVSLTNQTVEQITAKFDLSLLVTENENLEFIFEYNSDLFALKTIERLANSMQLLLRGIAVDATQPIAQLPLLGEKETDYLLYTLNETKVEYPDQLCIHHLFEQQVKKTPNNIAVSFAEQSLTYAQLNTKSNQLAHCLIEQGIKVEDFVGLCFERSLEMMVALMAILKAGAAYLPLDPSYPKDRLGYMMKDSDLSVILTVQNLLDITKGEERQQLALDNHEFVRQLSNHSSQNPDIKGLKLEHLAYVIYTSGSTGLPKGVMNTHKSLNNLCQWHVSEYNVTAEKRATHLASIAFDAAVWEIWPYLICGASIQLISDEVRVSPHRLLDIFKQRNITHCFLPTALLEASFDLFDTHEKTSLEYILTGGEKLSKFGFVNSTTKLVNHYGPTESTVVTISYVTNNKGKIAPPIGKPIANISTYILDNTMQLLPNGLIGELYLGGTGLARGYLNQPELTAEHFIQHTFSDNSTVRLYKTGDLVRYLTDGNLEFMGRVDHQVKIRGFRIELGEIEQLLVAHPEVQSALVIADEQRLLAYFTSNSLATASESINEIRSSLQKNLPDYMLPAVYIRLECFPLTVNGKVDHKALPKPDAIALDSVYLAPVGEVEEGLAQIWGQLLKVPQNNISANANFFELGGHSLLSIRLLAEVRAKFVCELSVRKVFENPQLRQLAQQIIGSNSSARPIISAIERTDKQFIPSYAQQRLWFIDQMDGGSAHYNMPSALRMHGDFKVKIAQTAFNEVIRRHEPLRTVFIAGNDGPLQIILEQYKFNITQIDLSHLTTDAQDQAIDRAIKEDAEQLFNLNNDLMLRVSYLRLSEKDGVMLFNMHHIASDGWSIGILIDEFVTLYGAYLEGKASPLAPLSIQYVDYAHWQRQWLSGEVLESQLTYWDKQLADLPQVHDLSLDFERPIQQTFNGALHYFEVESETLDSLNNMALNNQVTLFMLIHAAFTILLSRYSNNDDIVIGTPVANRLQKELEGLIGFFVNTLVLRVSCAGNPSFIELLEQIKGINLDAQANQDVPFEHLVDRLKPTRSTSHNALFQIMLNMNTNEDFKLTLPNVSLKQQLNYEVNIKFDLILNVDNDPKGNGLQCLFQYNTDLFKTSSIEHFADSFQRLLKSIVSDSTQTIAQLAILKDKETQQLLYALNDTHRDYPKQFCLHQLFEQQVNKTPNSIAVVFEQNAITYAELNTKANQLAHYLIEQGQIQVDSFIGLCVERSLEMVIGLMAILKTGAAYLPLDPSYPKARLEYMVQDSGLSLLLTQQNLIDLSKGEERKQIILDDQEFLNKLTDYSSSNPHIDGLSSSHLAYIIYTSGSTGKPKAVMVEHHSVVNLCMNIKQIIPDKQGYWGWVAPLSFDSSLKGLCALITGQALQIISKQAKTDEHKLRKMLEKKTITVLDCTPTLLEFWLSIGLEPLLPNLMIGGEAISNELWEQLIQWQVKYNKKAINLYGPTEACVDSSLVLIEGTRPNIGKALDNVKFFILDKNKQLTPHGYIGELYIAGAGLARGYFNQDKLTTERFIQHSFSQDGSERLYRTGDTVRYLQNNNLEFIGRIDEQVKVRGFRIELAEIEKHILTNSQVLSSLVTVYQGDEDKRLVAYFTAESLSDESIFIEALRSDLHQQLPNYMVPSLFIKLDVFPLTGNGKIDRKALPKPDVLGINGDYIIPSGKTEQILVKIWADLLKIPVEKISANGNFFELGGHSLLTIRLLAEVRIAFNCELSVRQVFETPKLSQFAQQIGLSSANIRPKVKTLKRKSTQLIPSYAQQRLWFIDQMGEGSVHYNMPSAIRLQGDFKVQAAQTAFTQIIQRHEPLRTVFVDSDDGLLQVVSHSFEFKIIQTDLTTLSGKKQQHAIETAIKDDAELPFNLNEDLMLRVSYLRLKADEGVMLFNMHHIASDGWSIGILVDEFVKLYHSSIEGKPSQLASLPIQYADYAHWQRQWLSGKVLDSQLTYWEKQLADLPQVHNLPLDYDRPQYQAFNGASCQVDIDSDTLKCLKSIAIDNQATLFMLIHATFSILLSRYSNSNDIVIATPVANRLQKELEGLIGFFVNTLVLRSDCSGNPSFIKFLSQIKNTNLDAQSNQDIPFEHLVDHINPPRSTSHNALFQIMLSMNTNEEFNLTLPGVEVSSQIKQQLIAKFDLVMIALPIQNTTDEGLRCSFVYNTDLFSAKTIQRLANSMQRLLTSIATDATQAIKNLPLLSDLETYYLLNTLNATQVNFQKDSSIHQLFEAQVAKTPDNIALIFENSQLTYTQLNQQANQLAHYLVKLGVNTNDFIGLYLERSLEMIIAIFATLKSGAVYLPLDPNNPKNRIDDMIKDSGLNIVLSKQHLVQQLNSQGLQIIALDNTQIKNNLNRFPHNNPVIKNFNNSHIAYMIYTSGSTGKPKGVTIEHKSIVNYVNAIDHYCNDVDGAIFITNFSFDGTLSILFPPLIKGQYIKIIPDNNDKFAALATELTNKKVRYLFKLTPSFLDTARSLVKTSGQGAKHTLILGGESFYSETYHYWSQVLPEATFINHYGPTEATVGCSSYYINKEKPLNFSNGLPIGKPLANYRFYILDQYQNLVPFGSVGELCIGGVGLARGYFNQTELTAAKFIQNPFVNGADERLYFSGDLVRYLTDGNIEFLGRIDHQVKIRGFRIELGEIEGQLNELGSIQYCLVIVHEDEDGEKRLLAYITSELELSETDLIADIRSQLQSSLPDYMIPSLFIVLDEMPLNINGKIDRKSLPNPDASSFSMASSDNYIPPEGAFEIALCKVWSELLKLPITEIGAHSDFFQCGGHSLLSIRLVAEVRAALSVELAIRDIFEYPLLSDLARVIANSQQSQRPKVVAFERSSNQLALSFAQQRLWFIDQMDTGSTQYNMPSAIRMQGDFKVEVAQAAFTQIIERHESLRTIFVDTAKGPVQIISEQFKFSISQVDLSDLTTALQDEAIETALKQDAQQSFNLNKDLMLRVSYLHINDDEGVMLFNMHHIASDGWSIGILIDEFVKLYRSNLEGKPNPLAALPIQYADYAHWQRNWLSGDVLESQLTYWDKQLADLPQVHNLPLDYERPEFQTFNGAVHHFTVDNKTSVQLNAIALDNQTTLFMLIHAAFSVLLCRYSNSNDIIIATPVANRLQKELEGIIGFFVNTLILRADCSNNPPFIEFLAQIKNTNLDAQSNQDVPFEHLVDRLNPPRSTSHNALFQIMLSMNVNEELELSLPNVSLSTQDKDKTTAKFDLSLYGSDNDGLAFSFDYNTDLFKAQTIERLAEGLQCLLQGIAKDASQPIAQLPLLSDKESHYLLNTLNNTQVTYPTDLCIHELFEQQVKRTPNNIAVVCKQQSLSYVELNTQANQLARYLIHQQVKPDSFIGLCVERSLEMMVGLLAILKAGCAYLPLDPSYPKDRLEHMLDDSQVKLLLTQKHFLDELNFDKQQITCIDELTKFNDYSNENIKKESINLSSNNLAYIIYTSGSTGKPKGAAVEHRNETNLLYWYCKEYSLNSDDKVLILSAIGFDLTQKNLFAPLISGASVQFASAQLYDVNTICDFIQDNHITFTNCAPSVFYPLVEHEHNINKLSSLRCVLFGGETIAFDRLNNWLSKASSDLQLINMYGPTECTDISCAYQIPIKENNNSAPIGMPNDNVQLYVLNQLQQLAPYGVAGELCVAGLGVSRGYLNQAALTAEKFIKHPFSDNDQEKIYRTGDWVKWMIDAQGQPQLEFIGRIDNQIKIRGFRVELGEIESRLNKHHDISQSVVIYDTEQQRLYAYLVAADDEAIDLTKVKIFLGKKLPDYMIPSNFIMLEQLPLTTHGKIDKKALIVLKGTGITVLQATEHCYIEPQGKNELTLSSIWSELLNIPQPEISADANFFALGGHSLLLTNMLHLIIEQLQVQLSVKDIFHAPSIGLIAKKIASKSPSDSQGLEKQDNSQPQPLSYGQYRIWFIEQLRDQTNEHNIAVASRITGDFKVEVLQQALNILIQQHDILRTRIMVNKADSENTPMQVIEPSFYYTINSIDLSDLPQASKDKEIAQLTRQQDTQVFDLSQLPLLSVLLLKVATDEYLLHFNQHHIISDGWSQQLFYGELMSLYQKINQQQEIVINTDHFNYADYARWQQHWLQSDTAAEQRVFWKNYLANCNEQLYLPIQNREGKLLGQQNHIQTSIAPALADQLKVIAREHKGSLFNVLHSGFVLLLARLSGESDFNIGLPVTGRHIYGTQNMLGMFLNTLPVRHNIDLSLSFKDLLATQIQNIEQVLSHQDLPLEQIFEITGCERNAETTPLFQILFNMLSVPDDNIAEEDFDFEMSKQNTAEIENKFNITLYLKESATGISLSCHYNSSAFSTEHVDNLIHQYTTLLAQIAADINKPCYDYCLNNGEHKINYECSINETDNNIDDVTALFRKQVKQNPKTVAIRDENNDWSYHELLQYSYGLATELKASGVKRGDIVTIMAVRQANLIAGILAVLQLGAAYSVVTTTMPESRIVQHMKIVENAVTLFCESCDSYDKELIAKIKALSLIKVMVNQPSHYQSTNTNAGGFIPEKDLLDLNACITFTSGSSGIPKAVAGKHLGLSGYLNWLPKHVGFSLDDNFGMLSALAHDPLQRDIFGALCIGATLVIPTKQQFADFQLSDWIKDQTVSVLHLTPAMAEIISMDQALDLSQLKVIFLTGETLRRDTVEALLQLNSKLRIFNCYGATETQRAATYFEITDINKLNAIIPISLSTPDTRLRLINDNNTDCGIGEIGQIHTESSFIARGYLNDKPLTQQRFIKLDKNLRRYATGDLGVSLDGKNIKYLGRADSQINIRGFRIELGEIEYQLSQHHHVKSCVAIVHNDEYIVIYVTAKDSSVVESEFIEKCKLYLQEHLAEYMLPAAIVLLDDIPLTANRKVDKKALPAVDEMIKHDQYQAPISATEINLTKIWALLLKLPEDKISVDANFFELGGHSLLLIKLITEIRNCFAQEISLKALFESRDLQSLADLIDSLTQQADISTQLDNTLQDEIEEVEF